MPLLDYLPHNDWRSFLLAEYHKPYFKDIEACLQAQSKVIYPPLPFVFRAFELCSLQDTLVVMLGQDPYHQEGVATGLAFSVADTKPLASSLKNIYKELETDLGLRMQPQGNLEAWARQGVLLLNTCLTVEANRPASHAHLGWYKLVANVLAYLSGSKKNLTFVLWGAHAQAQQKYIREPASHLIITSAHPSGLSAHRGFFGSKPFSRINAYVSTHHQKEIVWTN